MRTVEASLGEANYTGQLLTPVTSHSGCSYRDFKVPSRNIVTTMAPPFHTSFETLRLSNVVLFCRLTISLKCGCRHRPGDCVSSGDLGWGVEGSEGDAMLRTRTTRNHNLLKSPVSTVPRAGVDAVNMRVGILTRRKKE